MNIQIKTFKFSTIRKMIENKDLKYNLKELKFDLSKHNLKTLPFIKVVGFGLPMIYAIEYDNGEFEIISNSIFIELFLNFHVEFPEEQVKSNIFGTWMNRLKIIDNQMFIICILNLTKDVKNLKENELKHFAEFQLHSECFNLDEMYLES